jgi:hypothetical protein
VQQHPLGELETGAILRFPGPSLNGIPDGGFEELGGFERDPFQLPEGRVVARRQRGRGLEADGIGRDLRGDRASGAIPLSSGASEGVPRS